MEWLIQSGLKNFAQGLSTISLAQSYQPNASWSLGTMPSEQWKEVIDKIVTMVEEGA
jgi:CO dehydrogenase/acetyl-CoA synthase epsilon subunit